MSNISERNPFLSPYTSSKSYYSFGNKQISKTKVNGMMCGVLIIAALASAILVDQTGKSIQRSDLVCAQKNNISLQCATINADESCPSLIKSCEDENIRSLKLAITSGVSIFLTVMYIFASLIMKVRLDNSNNDFNSANSNI
ncbi:MAG: hypothetical protein JHC93_04875 [Parachlamydiales bacterium]|nr:hypothetical protein [Parachlamydiales bacterium]